MTIRLKENPDHANLPEIRGGDSVILEKDDWTPYLIEALVTNASEEDDTYVCKVTNILNKQNQEPVRGDDPLDLINENLLVERRQVWRRKEQ